MNRSKFVKIFLTIVFALSFQAPGIVTASRAAELPATAPAAAPITLTITNPLPKATTVSLSGTKSYTFYLPAGTTLTKTIDPGKYKFSYQGCLNKAKQGKLKVKKAGATLNIAACKMATWYFYNADDSMPYTLNLKGWMNYSITVNPHQALRFSWVADTYQAIGRACGKTYNFTLKVKGKKAWIVRACD